MTLNYKLVGTQPVPVDDIHEWAIWWKTADRKVRETWVGEPHAAGSSRVSTIFLGIDHGFGEIFPDLPQTPILFETMVFGGPLDGEQNRYATWDEAVEGHREIVMDVFRSEGEAPEEHGPCHVYGSPDEKEAPTQAALHVDAEASWGVDMHWASGKWCRP